MASSFPTSLDSFTDPASSDYLNSPDHADQHIDINDAVEKLQAKVGIDDSAVTTSIDYFINHASGDFRTHEHDGGSDDGAQLTWGNCWSDAVHTHASDAQGGTLDWDNCWADAVHAHSSDAEGGALYTKRAFSFQLNGTVSTGNEQGQKYCSPQDLTVKRIYAETDSGTCDIRIQKGTTTIDTIASVGDGGSSSTSFDESSISQDDKITLDVTGVSSCSGLRVTMECHHPIKNS